MPPPTPFGFTSAHVPLLSVLHERLTEYEDAIEHAYGVQTKYGSYGKGFKLDPPSGHLVRRMEQTAAAFDAVLQHVDRVDAHIERDYVLWHRDGASPVNALHSAASTDEAVKDRGKTLYTKSPILRHSRTLEFSFRPHPSCEVLVGSRILANSTLVQELAGLPG